MIRVLLCHSSQPEMGQAGWQKLIAYLEANENIESSLSAQPPTRSVLGRFDVIVLGSSWLPDENTAEDLIAYVRRGGGLICLGNSADGWATNPVLQKAFGLMAGQRTPTSELIVRVPAVNCDHPISRRLYAGYAHDHYAGLDRDTAFPLTDSFYLSESQNLSFQECQTVVLVSWQGHRRPVAWTQNLGEGRFFYTSLGTSDSSLSSMVFQQLIYRTIRYVDGQDEGKPVRVAMLGYGAIGLEHATAINAVPGLEFAAVCDRNPARLEEVRRSFESVRTCEDWQEIRDAGDVDLVIVSTPPNSHAAMALQLLEAGKHVVVEKPFCLTSREADAMVEMATRKERTLTVYQCRRWDQDYLAIKAAVAQDLIGEVFHVETFVGNFSHPCDYWHSDEEISGGVFYDWGSHYLDWILGLMPGRVQSVSGFAHKRVWHDVTNQDQSKVLMRFEGGREAEFIHSDIAAALKPKWYILGTKGAIVGDWRNETVKTRRWSGDLIEEHLAPSEALPILTAYLRQEGGPISEQKLALPPVPLFPFHRNLANHLLDGETLAVTPQQARRNIILMEAAKLSAAGDGNFIGVDC